MSNKKPSAGFDKDPARASAAGKKSSRKLPEEMKMLRDARSSEVELCIYKYIGRTVDELEQLADDKSMPMLDSIVIKNMLKAHEHANFAALEPMLVRSLGKVADKLQVAGVVASYKDVKVKAEDISEEDAMQKYLEMLKEVN